MKNLTSNIKAHNTLGIDTLNLQSKEDTMNNHFADLLDARDGVHPDRGDWTPETDEPDQDYLDTLQEDIFSSLVSDGHGVRVHKIDQPWLGKLNLDPDQCDHWMIDELTLATDLWEPPLERPHEDLTPLEAGPWEDEGMDEFGDWNPVEYQIPTRFEEYYDDTLDIIRETHLEEQRALQGLDHSFETAIRVSELSEAKERRIKRFEEVLYWVSTTEFRQLQCHKGRLWNKINSSRKQAGKYNRWGWVYLTKVQVNAINEVIKFRVGEYNDSFKRK